MRIGLVPFLNVAPFTEIPFDVVYEVPSKLNSMMRAGQLDVAFCSSVEYFEGCYERLPWGLAAKERIMSVNLYLKGEKRHARICLDPASATANALFRILAEDEEMTIVEGKADGFVRIGDEALFHQTIEGYKTYDLASWWFQKTGLPFVFALFIKQKGLETGALEEALVHSLAGFKERLPALARKHRFPLEKLEEYFSLCHYRLGEEEERGFQHFHDCYQRLLLGHCA